MIQRLIIQSLIKSFLLALTIRQGIVIFVVQTIYLGEKNKNDFVSLHYNTLFVTCLSHSSNNETLSSTEINVNISPLILLLIFIREYLIQKQ